MKFRDITEKSEYAEKREWFIKTYGKLKGREKYKEWVSSWERTKNITNPERKNEKM